MSKKIISLLVAMVIISLVLVTVNAFPELVYGQAAYASCTEKQTNKKSFIADVEKISIGQVCQSDARVLLYSCSDTDCNLKTKITESYKRNGNLVQFNKFDVGQRYHYECFSCETAPLAASVAPTAPTASKGEKCQIIVTEEEKVSLKWQATDPDKNVGPQGKLTYKYEGPVGETGEWTTKRGDAGIYQLKAKVYDGELWDETSLCVEVLKKNTAPTVVVPTTLTVAEGETAKLDANCKDAENDKTTISYTGWMTADTKATGFEDAGEYSAVLTCKDQFDDQSSTTVKITVLNKNRPPQITWISS